MSSLKYFIFSKTQLKERMEIEARLGKQFYAGTVLIRGKNQRYTQLVSNLEEIRFTDYKIIAQVEDLNSIKYTRPYSK